MFDKIKNTAKTSLLPRLRDIRFLGFSAFGVMVLLASWSGVKVIETNYELQKQIVGLDQTNQVDQLANENLKLKNQYYNSDTYLELQARRQFSKGAPGETLLLVPKDVALKYAKELPAEETKPAEVQASSKPMYRQNFDAWMDFLLHRSS